MRSTQVKHQYFHHSLSTKNCYISCYFWATSLFWQEELNNQHINILYRNFRIFQKVKTAIVRPFKMEPSVWRHTYIHTYIDNSMCHRNLCLERNLWQTINIVLFSSQSVTSDFAIQVVDRKKVKYAGGTTGAIMATMCSCQLCTNN